MGLNRNKKYVNPRSDAEKEMNPNKSTSDIKQFLTFLPVRITLINPIHTCGMDTITLTDKPWLEVKL